MKLTQGYLIMEQCPHCGIDKPSLGYVNFFESSAFDGTDNQIWAWYRCQRCGRMIMVSARNWNEGLNSIYPSAQIVDESVPEKARYFLKQAISSLNSPAGSIMLCASSLDAMLKAKEYKEGSLHARIEKAAADHLITEDMKLWAHEVRLDANDQRHADLDVGLPTTEDAKKTLEFVKAVAQFLFVLPARVKKGLTDAKSESKPDS